MFKLLIGLPLLLVGGAFALAFALPLLALLPVLLAIGAGALVLVLVCGVFGFVLRLFAGVLIGAGGLLIAALGIAFCFALGGIVLSVGFALAHLLVPLLLVLGLVWLIRRASRPSPPALPAPNP